MIFDKIMSVNTPLQFACCNSLRTAYITSINTNSAQPIIPSSYHNKEVYSLGSRPNLMRSSLKNSGFLPFQAYKNRTNSVMLQLARSVVIENQASAP
jgi:phenylalanyl-tRNA synthetase beta subunit